MFERLHRLLGHDRAATIAIVALTSAVFASVHLPEQGVAGAEQAVFTGLTFGAIYALTRSLWLPIVAHAAFDLTAEAMIYFDLESPIAQSIFG